MIQALFWHVSSWALTAPLALAATSTAVSSTEPAIKGPRTTITLFDPLKNVTFNDLIGQAIQGLTLLAVPVVIIMIIIGAYNIITSGGNPAKRSKGKDYILYAVIGFAILLLATSIQAIVSNFITSQST